MSARRLAGALLVVTTAAGCGSASSPKGFARPTTTRAVVTDEFINGFGGDPAVDYRFSVGRRRYTGYAVAGRDYHGKLKKGDRIRITYDGANPAKSCLC
jgi:hypothetical protein